MFKFYCPLMSFIKCYQGDKKDILYIIFNIFTMFCRTFEVYILYLHDL